MATDLVRQFARRLLSSSPDWQCVLDTPGLFVLDARHPGGACHAYLLKQCGGVILGRLFQRSIDQGINPPDVTFNEKETDLVIESGGRRLAECYWGHYVAFLRTSGSDRRYIFRDPTGGLPCFLLKACGIQMILSDMEDCVRLELGPFSVDWDHVISFFLHSRLISRTTGFREVTHLYAGECIAIDDDGETERTFYWDPVNVYATNAIEDPEEARALLGTTIRNCVSAWASCYDSIVHELSGGLDSSIVAACLAKARIHPDVLCFHFFTEMSEGDERAYARAAAHSAGFELIEREAPVLESTLKSHLSTARLATPAVLGFLPQSELFKQRLVAERHAGAVFTGQGGDQLFQQHKDKRIAAEYVRRHGIGPRFLNVVADTSRMTKDSIWSVFTSAISASLFKRPFDPYAFYFSAPSILTKAACTSLNINTYTHPWVSNARHLPGSKINQVFNVVDCQPFYQMFCPYAELVHPLISQPIIECSLQIPTYVLAHRGKPRGLVREAFVSDVPEKIIQRYSKGGTTSYFNRMLVENAEFLRQLLLDGALVSQGILDRAELEKQLSERELIRGTGILPVLNAVRAETWLDAWKHVARQRTAA